MLQLSAAGKRFGQHYCYQSDGSHPMNAPFWSATTEGPRALTHDECVLEGKSLLLRRGIRLLFLVGFDRLEVL